MKIYIVMGFTGEYSDAAEWRVVAYTTKEQAEIHIQRINAIIKEYTKRDYNTQNILQNRIIEEGLDSNCRVDYTGVSYNIEEIELFRHFDEFQDAT